MDPTIVGTLAVCAGSLIGMMGMVGRRLPGGTNWRVDGVDDSVKRLESGTARTVDRLERHTDHRFDMLKSHTDQRFDYELADLKRRVSRLEDGFGQSKADLAYIKGLLEAHGRAR